VKQAKKQRLPIQIVQRDRDSKYAKSFDQVLRRNKIKPKIGAYRAPNTNAFVERFVQSIQQECLDRFVVFGERHMDQGAL
jgi:putative transposase